MPITDTTAFFESVFRIALWVALYISPVVWLLSRDWF